jgi:GT2 family glycosyltransferase
MQALTERSISPSDHEALPASSLIICSRNRPDLVSDTIASILQAEAVPSELIVIDQSDKPQVEWPQFTSPRCEVRYEWAPSIGSSRARNMGVAVARHPIIAFVDDDMWVTPNWYGELIRALVQAGPRAAVTGRVLPAHNEKLNGFVIAVHEWEDLKTYEGRIGRDILATGHMATYRAVLDEVGGLDERLGPGAQFPAAEDNDLGFRILEAGYRIVYVPQSVIYHRAWRTRKDYIPLFWRYGRGQGAFYAKHLTLRDRYMLHRAGNDFSRYIRLLPGRIWRHQLLVLSGATAFILGILVGVVQWILTERKVRA